MFTFGIATYEPCWLSGLGPIRTAHGERLRSLIGRRLSAAWLVWDLDDDEWFADCPVLLDFEGVQVAINHRKFDDLSITWGRIDPEAPIDWPGEPEFRLAWRNDVVAELSALHGRELTGAELLEWCGSDMANGMVAVSFVFGPERLSVDNALDENGLSFAPPVPDQRVHAL